MHMMQEPDSGIDVVSAGINLTEFYPSVEWDILDVPARKNEERYPCCEEPYPGKESLFFSVGVYDGSLDSSLMIIDRLRYHVQRNDAKENSVLHRQLDHPLCRHHLSNNSRLLLAIRFGRKGSSV